MRIVVVNIAASEGGALSVLRDFYESLKASDDKNEWIFLLGDHYLNETQNIKVLTFPRIKKHWISRLSFDLYRGKNIIKQLNPDVVFSMQNIMVFGSRYPQVIYVHQPLPFQTIKEFSPFKRSEMKLFVYQKIIGSLIKKSIKRANKVIIQTEWMKSAIQDQLNVSEKKLIKIRPSIASVPEPSVDRQICRNHFFYPTSNVLYKNNECIYKACQILLAKGIQDFEVKLTISGESEMSQIKQIGRIERDQVLKEYSNSILLFPSYIETYGLPLAEARKAGSIIFASQCEFSKEILNGYQNGYYFDPFQPEQLALLMEQAITNQLSYSNQAVEEDNAEYDAWKNVVDHITHYSTDVMK